MICEDGLICLICNILLSHIRVKPKKRENPLSPIFPPVSPKSWLFLRNYSVFPYGKTSAVLLLPGVALLEREVEGSTGGTRLDPFNVSFITKRSQILCRGVGGYVENAYDLISGQFVVFFEQLP